MSSNSRKVSSNHRPTNSLSSISSQLLSPDVSTQANSPSNKRTTPNSPSGVASLGSNSSNVNSEKSPTIEPFVSPNSYELNNSTIWESGLEESIDDNDVNPQQDEEERKEVSNFDIYYRLSPIAQHINRQSGSLSNDVIDMFTSYEPSIAGYNPLHMETLQKTALSLGINIKFDNNNHLIFDDDTSISIPPHQTDPKRLRTSYEALIDSYKVRRRIYMDAETVLDNLEQLQKGIDIKLDKLENETMRTRYSCTILEEKVQETIDIIDNFCERIEELKNRTQ